MVSFSLKANLPFQIPFFLAIRMETETLDGYLWFDLSPGKSSSNHRYFIYFYLSYIFELQLTQVNLAKAQRYKSLYLPHHMMGLGGGFLFTFLIYQPQSFAYNPQ